MDHTLPNGLPAPMQDGLAAPYWAGTRAGKLVIQRCRGCNKFQWGPEWICHRCRSFDLDWQEVHPRGRIYSWQRPFHPVQSALKGHGPYLIVLVELPEADDVRMIVNLIGDPQQVVTIGDPVQAVFEPHDEAAPPYTLAQWSKRGQHWA